MVLNKPYKYAKVLVRCPKCKGEYYTRAEIKKGTLCDTEPLLKQPCRLCGKEVSLIEQ